MARALVVVRAGDTSLHPGWLVGAAPEWDLAVSYFGDDATRTFEAARYVHRYKGGKWDGLHAFFAEFPAAAAAYDYFWLPDDDIQTDARAINAMFDAMRRHNLELAQPGLTSNSYFQHPITLANPIFKLRYATMIEIMVPILDQRLLNLVLPLFAVTRSGFGLDYVWHRLTTDPVRKAAILDEISVTHTRPIGRHLANTLRAMSTDPESERADMTARIGIEAYHAVAFGGVMCDGRAVPSRGQCALLQVLGLARFLYRTRWSGDRPRGVAWKYMKLIRFGLSQIRYRPELSIIPESIVQRNTRP
jgi:hypothetical protein